MMLAIKSVEPTPQLLKIPSRRGINAMGWKLSAAALLIQANSSADPAI